MPYLLGHLEIRERCMLPFSTYSGCWDMLPDLIEFLSTWWHLKSLQNYFPTLWSTMAARTNKTRNNTWHHKAYMDSCDWGFSRLKIFLQYEYCRLLPVNDKRGFVFHYRGLHLPLQQSMFYSFQHGVHLHKTYTW